MGGEGKGKNRRDHSRAGSENHAEEQPALTRRYGEDARLFLIGHTEGVTWQPGCRPAMQGAGLATQATFVLMQRLWGVPQRQGLKKASRRSRKETMTSHREIYTGG